MQNNFEIKSYLLKSSCKQESVVTDSYMTDRVLCYTTHPCAGRRVNSLFTSEYVQQYDFFHHKQKFKNKYAKIKRKLGIKCHDKT